MIITLSLVGDREEHRCDYPPRSASPHPSTDHMLTFEIIDSAFGETAKLSCTCCPFVGKTKAALSNHVKTHGLPVTPYKPVNRRKRPTMETKLEVMTALAAYIAQHGESYPRIHFDRQSGYASQCISDWIKYPRLRQVAALPYLACFKRLRTFVTLSNRNFRLEEDILYERFVYRRRARGQQVDKEWLKHEMLKIVRDKEPPAWKTFKASNGWLDNFIKTYEISCQTQTEKKGMSNSFRVPLLKIFHENLCRIQQTHGVNPRDPVYGRFSPLTIWNTDQIPISFIQAKRRSYNPKNTPCWLITHGPSSTAKRSATLVLTLRAGGPQIIPPMLLFRGKGCLDSELLAELDEHGIAYAFNEKAWANEASCMEHLVFFHQLVKAKCPEFTEHMLLLDGLSCQATSAYIELALDLHILPVYFPPNCTHLVQPVDHRVAAFIKKCLASLFKKEEELMYELWQQYRDNGSMKPRYQRNMILKWIGCAWKELCTGQPILLQHAFTSTGCLITLKGEHNIRFPDIDNYDFTYPSV